MTWAERDDVYHAAVNGYRLKVWQSKQYQSWGWTVERGHIIRAGDMKTLEDAQKVAKAAVEARRQI